MYSKGRVERSAGGFPRAEPRRRKHRLTVQTASAGIASIRSPHEMLLPDSGYFRRPCMVLKNVFAAMVCAAVLACSGLSAADEYRPDQFLSLDLSKAVLSPKRLGPPAEFAPFPIEARADRARERVAGTENARAVAVSKIHVAHRPNAKPH